MTENINYVFLESSVTVFLALRVICLFRTTNQGFHLLHLVGIVFMAAAGVTAQLCPLPNASWYSIKNRCFWRLGHATTAVGETLCQVHGGHLATVYDQSTTTWLHANVLDSNCGSVWTGINDIQAERVWVIWDGSPVLWTNWKTSSPAQPAGGNTINCVMLDTNCEWRDRQCVYEYKVLCESPALTPQAGQLNECTQTMNHSDGTKQGNFHLISSGCSNHSVITTASSVSRLSCAVKCATFTECVGFAYKGNSCKLLKTSDQNNCLTDWKIYTFENC